MPDTQRENTLAAWPRQRRRESFAVCVLGAGKERSCPPCPHHFTSQNQGGAASFSSFQYLSSTTPNFGTGLTLTYKCALASCANANTHTHTRGGVPGVGYILLYCFVYEKASCVPDAVDLMPTRVFPFVILFCSCQSTSAGSRLRSWDRTPYAPDPHQTQHNHWHCH